MTQSYDMVVFWLTLLALLLLFFRPFLRRLPIQIGWVNLYETDPLEQLLHRKGYRLIRKHIRVPILFSAGDETHKTRIFVDGVAKKEGKWYLVRIARARKPLLYTGSGMRDEFIPFALLRKWDGILYVNLKEESLQQISFQVDRSTLPGPIYILPSLLLFFLGFLLAFLIK